MSIIIRLQNLPLEANSLDIRRFFQNLHIPDGGVHIVGGENGDAFIAFGSDEDARQAMERDGNLIKNSRIKLLLSSRNEMQRVIDNARTQTSAAPKAVGPSPVNSQYGVSHQGQYPQATPPQPQISPKPSTGLNPYGQIYPGSQGPPQQVGPSSGYGILPQQPQSPPTGHSNDPYQRQHPPFRSRSRSRSPPPQRIRPDISSGEQGFPPINQTVPMSAHGNMQSGLMGSFQQAPPPQQAPSQYSQNGSYPPNGNNNGAAPSQVPYDNGNYYRQQPPPQYQQSGPGVETPKYGQDDRWNTQPQNNMGQSQNDNFRQNDMYRNQALPPTGPPQQQQQVSYQQQPPVPQYQQSYSNEPSMSMTQPNQGFSSNPPQNSGRMFTLQVWNLPLNVRSIDLVEFFTPLYLNEDNIKIFNDDRGFPTGLALVRFPTAREFDNALNYNGKFMNDRQIQVRPLDENSGTPNNAPLPSQQPPLPPPTQSVSESYIDPNYPPGFRHQSPGPGPDVPYTNTRGPPPMSGSGPPGPYQGGPHGPSQGPNKDLAVFMKGLPFSSCTTRDVDEFFKPIRLAHVEIERDSRGKPSGNAFVEFDNRQDFERGMQYNMKHMGRRYIELIPLTKMDRGPRGFHGGPPTGGYPGGDRNGPVPTHCISVKGLSPNVTSHDLKIFFGNQGARPFAVHIMLTPNQLNAGEAFLEFVDKEFQKRALKHDGETIGHDRIHVRAVPYELVMNAIQQPPINNGGGPHMNSGPDYYREGKGGRGREKTRGPSGPPPFQEKASCLVAFGCSLKAKDEDFCVFFDKYKITPDRIKRRINDNSIDAQISFLNRADADHALKNMDNKFFLDRSIRLDYLL